MDRLIHLYKTFLGPRLYAVYALNARGRFDSVLYEANIFERTADQTLATANGVRGLATSLWPLTLVLFYRRGWFDSEWLFKVGVFCTVLYSGAYFVRTIGRLMDSRYQTFITTLLECERDPNAANRRSLQLYDFDIWAKPVDYNWSDIIRGEKVKRRKEALRTETADAWEWRAVQLTQDALCYVAVHSFGRRMLYPGSVSLLNALVHPALLEGRKKLMNQGAVRNKLVTREGDAIDTAFVDRRNNAGLNGSNGNILVVTCEGNAGFYEIGGMGPILELGYSVLGWNHPGFAQSSGTPWPTATAAAVDTTIQYATSVLGFAETDVVIYAWSIGGYPATWAAMNYPDLRAVVLDATFDDLVPLAKAKMPASWAHLVQHAVRDYLDLPISLQLAHYNGPVLLIRCVMAVVLDATFDDLVPLAKAKMPASWAHLVQHAVRDYLDLPISLQLAHYNGPVLLIRCVMAVVLDATFDNLVPLAKAKMPASWAHLVQHAVRDYLDLPILLQLAHYNGPVLLIRCVMAVVLDATFDDLVPLAKAKMPASWAHLVQHATTWTCPSRCSSPTTMDPCYSLGV